MNVFTLSEGEVLRFGRIEAASQLASSDVWTFNWAA